MDTSFRLPRPREAVEVLGKLLLFNGVVSEAIKDELRRKAKKPRISCNPVDLQLPKVWSRNIQLAER